MICPHCGGEIHNERNEERNERFARIKAIDPDKSYVTDEELMASIVYEMIVVFNNVELFERVENKRKWWRLKRCLQEYIWHETWLDFNVAENNQAPVDPSVITTTNIRRITPRKSPNET